MHDWTRSHPRIYDIVTGFFPEARPKASWAENPRPMLVTGVFRGRTSGEIRLRVAYGTSQVEKIRWPNLNVGNLSNLNDMNLARPTAFVIHPASQMELLRWSDQHFACWSGFSTPIIGRLPPEMQDHVAKVMLSNAAEVPQP